MSASPRLLGFLGVLALMVLITVLSYGVLPREELGALRNPSMAGVLQAVVGPWGAVFVSAGLIVSVMGAYLSWSLLAAEVLFSAAKMESMPAFLTRENARAVPAAALWLTNALVQSFLIITLFAEQAFLLALKLTSSMILIPYLLVAAYALKLAMSGESYRPAAPERRGDLVRAGLATLYALGLIYAGGLKFLLLSAVIYAPGTLLYVITRREQGSRVFTVVEVAMFAVAVSGALAAAYGLATGQDQRLKRGLRARRGAGRRRRCGRGRCAWPGRAPGRRRSAPPRSVLPWASPKAMPALAVQARPPWCSASAAKARPHLLGTAQRRFGARFRQHQRELLAAEPRRGFAAHRGSRAAPARTCAMTRSPVAWPCSSLMRLKRSMSNRMTAIVAAQRIRAMGIEQRAAVQQAGQRVGHRLALVGARQPRLVERQRQRADARHPGDDDDDAEVLQPNCSAARRAPACRRAPASARTAQKEMPTMQVERADAR